MASASASGLLGDCGEDGRGPLADLADLVLDEGAREAASDLRGGRAGRGRHRRRDRGISGATGSLSLARLTFSGLELGDDALERRLGCARELGRGRVGGERGRARASTRLASAAREDAECRRAGEGREGAGRQNGPGRHPQPAEGVGEGPGDPGVHPALQRPGDARVDQAADGLGPPRGADSPRPTSGRGRRARRLGRSIPPVELWCRGPLRVYSSAHARFPIPITLRYAALQAVSQGVQARRRRARLPARRRPRPARRPARRRRRRPRSVSPSLNSPSSRRSASLSTSCFWITRFSGRAP